MREPPSTRTVLAVAEFAGVVGVIIGLVIAGPFGSSSNGGEPMAGTVAGAPAQTTTKATAPSSVSLELRTK